jgi:AcrR family transcriptional regulator
VSAASRPTTKERILGETAQMFTLQGYVATGIKEIAARASAPFGSIYHHFPGGKRELAAVVLRQSGGAYGGLVPLVFDAAADVVQGTRDFFGGAAQHLVDTDYADACPIGTVALEVASTDEMLRSVIADVFAGWLALLDDRLVAAGIAATRARELSLTFLAALEGGFMVARTLRSTQPMSVAGDVVAEAIQASIPTRSTRRRTP